MWRKFRGSFANIARSRHLRRAAHPISGARTGERLDEASKRSFTLRRFIRTRLGMQWGQ